MLAELRSLVAHPFWRSRHCLTERRVCDATHSRHASLRWAQHPLTKRHSSKASLPDQHQRWITSGNESEGSTDMRPSLFVGAYTAVTKALWHKRLNWRGTPPVGAALPPIYEKHPELTSVEYPFTTDREFLEMYRNPWNHIRMGRVLEDMDSMAGNIAFVHCDDGDPATLPPMLVTAAVERIEMIHSVDLEHDATLSGQVVFTGSSSLDVRLILQQAHLDHPSIVALVTFVARDPVTQKATKINPLVPQTSEQKQWFEERAAAAQARKAARKAAESRVTSCGTAAGSGLKAHGRAAGQAEVEQRRAWAQGLLAEARLMSRMPVDSGILTHGFHRKGAVGYVVHQNYYDVLKATQEILQRHVPAGLTDGSAVLMDSTRLSNTFTCQPQNRNMHGRIFGGFLMRRAYELAYATVHMFAGTRPRFVQVDRVDFKNPVDIGDLVTFGSGIMHARNLLQHSKGPRARIFVEVEASVNRPEQQTTFPTNTFQFTFETQLDVTNDPTAPKVRLLKRVLPATEAQASEIEEFWH